MTNQSITTQSPAATSQAPTSAVSSQSLRPFILRASIFLLIWLLLLAFLSLRGFFSSFQLPPRLPLALLIPLPIVVLTLRSRPELLNKIQPQWPVYLQSFRILVEIGLWLLVRNGSLPVQMSFEGRNFDILAGLLAFPVGYYCFVKKTWPTTIATIYNIGGLLLLLNIVAISTLSLPAPFRAFHNQPDSSLITHFPLIYLPGLLVPLAYTLHIISIRQRSITFPQ